MNITLVPLQLNNYTPTGRKSAISPSTEGVRHTNSCITYPTLWSVWTHVQSIRGHVNEYFRWENNFKVYTLGPYIHTECRRPSAGFGIFFKKRRIREGNTYFWKKKEIHIKKEENTHFIISLLKKEGNTHKKEGSIFSLFLNKRRFSLV